MLAPKAILLSLVAVMASATAAPLHFDPVLKPTLYDIETLSTITNDKPVKKIHSHNDYWREIPLLTALSYGVQSVEADVWLFEGDDSIYVGHNFVSLTGTRTLKSLYIDPLYDILELKNVQRELDVKFDDRSAPSGVFEMDSSATLYFFIDMKTDGETTFEPVFNAFQSLRDEGYLTFFNETSGELQYGPITVIGTGDTPLEKVQGLSNRDFFFDGSLLNLTGVTPGLSPIASASINKILGEKEATFAQTGLSDEQSAKIKLVVDQAHEQGLLTRIWEAPLWTNKKKLAIWEQLIDLGSDFLNADNLEQAAGL